MTKNDNRVYVIANMSTNHEGNVSLANEMIEEACKCGADYVFMELDNNTSSFSNEDITNFHKLAEENGAVFTTKSFWDSIRQISPIQQFKNINDAEDDILYDSNNMSDMIQVIPTFVSEKDKAENSKTYETVDLVEKIQQKFPKHELQFWEFQEMTTCLLEVVVAIGIKAISCKFTLDDKRPGFDHATSIRTRDLRTMIANIRTVEVALGTGKKDKLSPSELPCFKKLFKSVVASKNLERGSILKAEDMKIKVSDTQSMCGFYFSIVIGRQLLSEVDEDDPIFVSDFEGLKNYTSYMPYINNPIKECSDYVSEINLGRSVNFKSPCYIIAEIGQNHQGDIMMAKKLIKLAKKCGADCVKFQKSCLVEKFTLLALNRPYNSKNSFGSTYGEHKRFLEFTEEQYKELRKYAKKVGIHFTASAMDPVSLDFIVALKVPFVKIGSGESGNVMLLEKAAKTYVPLVISTGMQTLADIRITYETVSRHHNHFALLHCVSAYPTPPDEANLNMIKTLRKTYPNTIIGYSGHEVGSCITTASVALGAKIIERHITLDRNMKGSDHICSLDPSQFSKLVRDIRYIEQNLAI
ncbi:Aldolase-type TIM barrel,Antifreeze-like/N-acetylneuraminic acid synthase C-terminal,N- [Cinara cedri]|uniref:Aldolase-type TIM barrel,Antifreeze-like/N-acetylneuraminic acid synthase C-terminal,N n=1 Tax=Cinara cedri TaxID=506608 RepID=A0A5E4MF07_9HEMI|nr:Aldolase-type TIM barrel,Antifreeze-like/N-acetylneuraminic acid synthase C-terminal,N- [Cinara cedri]